VKNINLLTVGLSCLVVGAAIGYGLRGGTQTTDQISSTPTPSPDFSYYENLLKQDRQVIINNPQPTDLTGDGKPEIIYITSGEGCASCHQQFLYIFDGQNQIFWRDFGDPIFVAKDKAFMVFQPIRKAAEPLCCPTSFNLITYTWDGQTFQEQK